MNLSLVSYTLLAQGNRLEQMGRGMRASRERVQLVDLWPLALGLLLIIGVTTAYNAWKRRRDFKEKCYDPQKLFRELCAIHQLNGSQRRSLKSLADACEYEQPAQVFLIPSAFEQQLPSKLSGKAEHYKQLRGLLF